MKPGQDGFTLIELIVVMIITAILMAVAVPMYLSSRKSAERRELVSNTTAYADAIAGFALDRAGRVPSVIGGDVNTADWPVAASGPVDPTRRPYLKSGPPELVQNGRVVVGAAAAGGARATIEYVWVSRSTYRLWLRQYENGTVSWQCQTGTAAVDAEVRPC